jgi:hypothetical protein
MSGYTPAKKGPAPEEKTDYVPAKKQAPPVEGTGITASILVQRAKRAALEG